MTNPLDAWRPKVLDKVFYSSPVMEIKSSVSTQLVQMAVGALITQFTTAQFTTARFNFTIPEDYKYALVKVEVVNLNPEGIDDFGDAVSVMGGIVDQNKPQVLQEA